MKAPHQSTLVALIFVASLACAAHANNINGESTYTPVDAQKGIYFVCERASTNGAPNTDGVTYCKIAFETKQEQRNCETGLSQAIVSRRDYASKDCARLKALLPKTTAP